MRNLLLCATLLASNFSLSPLSLALDVGGAAGGAKGAVGGAVGGAAGAVGGAVGGAAGAVGGAVGGAAGAVGGAVGGAAGAVGGAVGGAAGAVGGAVGGAAGAVGGAVGGAAGGAARAVGGVAKGAAGAVGNVARGATGTATGAIGGTTAAVGQAVATGAPSTRSTTSSRAGALLGNFGAPSPVSRSLTAPPQGPDSTAAYATTRPPSFVPVPQRKFTALVYLPLEKLYRRKPERIRELLVRLDPDLLRAVRTSCRQVLAAPKRFTYEHVQVCRVARAL